MSEAGPQDLGALGEFEAALARYLVWTKKEQGAAIEDRGRKVRLELFKQFRRLAKSSGELRAEVAGLGFAVKRRAVGALAKEYPAAAAVGAVPRVSTEQEVKLRVRSLRFLSVSFLFKSWKAAAEGQTGRFAAVSRARKEIGQALVQTQKGNESPFVQLTSLLEGVVAQNRERNLADAALRAQARDMADYVARKHREQLERTFRKTYSAALGAVA